MVKHLLRQVEFSNRHLVRHFLVQVGMMLIETGFQKDSFCMAYADPSIQEAPEVNSLSNPLSD